MDEQTLRSVVRDEVRLAVREELPRALKVYGTDVHDPLAEQADRRFLRILRTSTESGTAKAIAAGATAILLAAVGFVVAGIKARFFPGS